MSGYGSVDGVHGLERCLQRETVYLSCGQVAGWERDATWPDG
jgi:hypothetical protein